MPLSLIEVPVLITGMVNERLAEVKGEVDMFDCSK
jgi:hypothetical protein